ncbi:MAG TPA: hypothetical protein VD913_05515 [bacterium]|nr:hypothetical protein [bacterium]
MKIQPPIYRDGAFLIGIAAALFIFFPQVFFLKLSFLSGDHRVQHYPWAFYFAQGIKHWCLPWWTSTFQTGFPLLAEGQVGAFYPLNLIFYTLFPFNFAYTYEILTHYLLGGFFFYIYLRSAKVSVMAAFFGCLIYLFATAQGGYYYNLNSQKVLIWLPLTFLVMDQIHEKEKKRYIFWLALLFAVQIFAGYFQYAVYSIGFSCFYFVWFALKKAWEQKKISGGFFDAGLLLFSLMLAVLITLPQTGSTLELVRLSRRTAYPLEFALVGSMNPAALATLFFPHWDGFLRSEIYAGAVGLFFLILSLSAKKSSREIFFWSMAALALLLALGKFNPLYAGAIRLTQFSGFRVPAKFIYFAAFAFSVLCAYGFDKWRTLAAGDRSLNRAIKIFCGLILAAFAGLLISNIVLRMFEVPIKDYFRQYITHHFAGTILHPRPLESYLQQFEGMYGEVLDIISLADPWTLGFSVFMVAAMIWIPLSVKIKNKHLRLSSWVFTGIIFLNLYFYSYTSIKGSLESFSFLKPESPIVDILKKDPTSFRLHRVLKDTAHSEELPIVPQNNILYGIPLTGAYSPLVTSAYYDAFEGLGDINDSQKLLVADETVFGESAALIDFLGIKYLLSDAPLQDTRYRPLIEDQGWYLYENPQAMPRAFFVGEDQKISDKGYSGPYTPVEMTEDARQQKIEIHVDAPHAGYLVLSDFFYPGWKVFIDGRRAEILKAAGLFRQVYIDKPGPHKVRFIYDPVWKKLVKLTAALSLLCLILPVLLTGWRARTPQIQGP